jgi:hypothetical protein
MTADAPIRRRTRPCRPEWANVKIAADFTPPKGAITKATADTPFPARSTTPKPVSPTSPSPSVGGATGCVNASFVITVSSDASPQATDV